MPPRKAGENLWDHRHRHGVLVFTDTIIKLLCEISILFYFIHLYRTEVITKQGAGVPEGSDLGVGQASEQG